MEPPSGLSEDYLSREPDFVLDGIALVKLTRVHILWYQSRSGVRCTWCVELLLDRKDLD